MNQGEKKSMFETYLHLIWCVYSSISKTQKDRPDFTELTKALASVFGFNAPEYLRDFHCVWDTPNLVDRGYVKFEMSPELLKVVWFPCRGLLDEGWTITINPEGAWAAVTNDTICRASALRLLRDLEEKHLLEGVMSAINDSLQKLMLKRAAVF